MFEELVNAVNENNIKNVHEILIKIKKREGLERYENGVILTLMKASSNNNLEIIKSVFSTLNQDQINELGARGLSAAKVYHSNNEIIDYFISNIDVETLIQKDGFELLYSKFKPQKEENLDNTEKLLMEKQREILAIKIAYSLYNGFDLNAQTQKVTNDAEIITRSLELLNNKLIEEGLHKHETINEYKEFIETKYANIINPEKIFQITSFLSKLEDNIASFETFLYEELYGDILIPYNLLKRLTKFQDKWRKDLQNLGEEEFNQILNKKMIEAEFSPMEIKTVESNFKILKFYVDHPQYVKVGNFLTDIIKNSPHDMEKSLLKALIFNDLLTPIDLEIILPREINFKFKALKDNCRSMAEDPSIRTSFKVLQELGLGDAEGSLYEHKSFYKMPHATVNIVEPLNEPKIEEKIEFKTENVGIIEFTPLVLNPIATIIEREDNEVPTLGENNNTES